MTNRALNIFSIVLVVLAVGAIAAKNVERRAPVELLNVSYDPTRELYARINPLFEARYEEAVGKRISIKQSHGGSSQQARSVIAGRHAADVVTLGLPSDVDSLRKHGLIADRWSQRLPNNAQPYYSTIVFVVRRGNPLGIRDWPDLVKPGVEVITPDPKTSGNGKLSALAGWGATLQRGGTEADARAYLKALYEHAPFLEAGARAAAVAFAVEKLGNVHLAWENEALREVAEASGELELVYPPISILAEPAVAWVDVNVAKHDLKSPAEAYLAFLFTDEAQEIIAQSGYRPFKQQVLEKHGARFPRVNLFPITAIAESWDDAQHKFFAENGIIETVYEPKPR
ncbi:sulfate ABC transporter substrate-binding protein [Sorangium sp. So ce131]|uniref:sulfate ABC transporter substrate-binding protein n=1 Tax=Sorangium sp. So ce131 TaxID=3133282 RepID=UPI003F63250F